MSLAANVIYHDDRAHYFAMLAAPRCDCYAHVTAYAEHRARSHRAAWRELVLSQAGEG